jgi:hypothetical protein
MINEVGSLAMNMHEQPGVFALLLGSGVSSGAGIPTGHAVTIDLIRRYASSIDESAEPEPESLPGEDVARQFFLESRQGQSLVDEPFLQGLAMQLKVTACSLR